MNTEAELTKYLCDQCNKDYTLDMSLGLERFLLTMQLMGMTEQEALQDHLDKVINRAR